MEKVANRDGIRFDGLGEIIVTVAGISLLHFGCAQYTPFASDCDPFLYLFPHQIPGRIRPWASPREKTTTCLIWNPTHGHLSRQLLSAVQIDFVWVPRMFGWQRQTLHPPQHVSNQPLDGGALI